MYGTGDTHSHITDTPHNIHTATYSPTKNVFWNTNDAELPLVRLIRLNDPTFAVSDMSSSSSTLMRRLGSVTRIRRSTSVRPTTIHTAAIVAVPYQNANPQSPPTTTARIGPIREFSTAHATDAVTNSDTAERNSGSAAAPENATPTGELFRQNGGAAKHIGPTLVGQKAEIVRVFGPRSNADAMLTCGGPVLAAHASFDPEYERARHWIRHHAVGPAVLSPVLIAGLTGALVEAVFPQAVPLTQSMTTRRPLIVGVSVVAQITVAQVSEGPDPESTTAEGLETPRSENGRAPQQQQHAGKGYTVHLDTRVLRVRDDAVIAEGTHCIWIPDYLRM